MKRNTHRVVVYVFFPSFFVVFIASVGTFVTICILYKSRDNVAMKAQSTIVFICCKVYHRIEVYTRCARNSNDSISPFDNAMGSYLFFLRLRTPPYTNKHSTLTLHCRGYCSALDPHARQYQQISHFKRAHNNPSVRLPIHSFLRQQQQQQQFEMKITSRFTWRTCAIFTHKPTRRRSDSSRAYSLSVSIHVSMYEKLLEVY